MPSINNNICDSKGYYCFQSVTKIIEAVHVRLLRCFLRDQEICTFLKTDLSPWKAAMKESCKCKTTIRSTCRGADRCLIENPIYSLRSPSIICLILKYSIHQQNDKRKCLRIMKVKDCFVSESHNLFCILLIKIAVNLIFICVFISSRKLRVSISWTSIVVILLVCCLD